jgi:opacity protein-like surface antigen
MANARYSFGNLGPLRPYIGAGLGASRLEMTWSRTQGASPGDLTDTSWDFAYQGLLGADVEIADRWSLYAQYQYFRIPSPGVSTRRQLTATVSQAWAFEDYKAQSVSIGLRRSF